LPLDERVNVYVRQVGFGFTVEVNVVERAWKQGIANRVPGRNALIRSPSDWLSILKQWLALNGTTRDIEP
jgi:hypothetical protein